MLDNIIISGFADEIDMNLDEQLRVVKELGMNYICIRAADGKGIADYTPEEFQEKILPRLKAAGVGVSSLGSPIGKIGIDDEQAYATQLKQLENLCQICKLADCKYIRMFSFWMPKDKNPDDFTDQVLEKLEGFAKVAEKYDVILIHENEKDIYGDIGRRCKVILDRLASPHFKAAFDFANFVQCGEDTEVCWEMLKQHVVYIHIKDAEAGTGTIVPPGKGAGHLAEILAKFKADGYTGFISLEPHLTNFTGLSGLEKEVEERHTTLTGEEAFTLAHDCLVEILDKI